LAHSCTTGRVGAVFYRSTKDSGKPLRVMNKAATALEKELQSKASQKTEQKTQRGRQM